MEEPPATNPSRKSSDIAAEDLSPTSPTQQDRAGFISSMLGLVAVFASIGMFVLVYVSKNEPPILDYVGISVAVLFFLLGLGVPIFAALRLGVLDTADDRVAQNQTDLEYTVAQLSKNYEILRRQTIQGFFLAGVFMLVGGVIIAVAVAANIFGADITISNLGTISGLVLEFISGTALLLYRLNFGRLNETSDKLDNTSRILMAFRLAESLPAYPNNDLKAEATTKLIDALIGNPQKKSA